jgi:cytochrome P450
MHTVSSHADVTAILSDPRFVVPTLPAADGPPADGPPVGIGWLRAHVARFSTGTVHRRRRALATAELDRMDPPSLGHRAGALAAHHPSAAVPVVVLAEALGVTASVAADVATVAGGYHPGTGTGADIDAAVGRLVEAFGGTPDEATAARIGLLVQACTATAGLIANARRHRGCGAPVEAVLTETLRHDPPVPMTTRVAADGTLLHLDLAAANRDPRVFADPDEFDPDRPDCHRHLTFGAGLRPCPGQAHALAIAMGVLDV